MTQKTVKAIPLVYHGSPNNFDTFNSKKLGTATDKYDDPNISSSLGFFFTTDKQYAKNYAIGENGVLYTCKLSINNPFVYDMEDYIATDRKITAVITEGKEKGHDSIILLNIRELGRPKATEYVVFNPSQIEIKHKEDIKNIVERLEQLIDETIYITKSPYDIANLLKNKPKDYRIIYDNYINTYMIGDSNKYIHEDLILKAFEQGCYAGCTQMDSFLQDIDEPVLTKDNVVDYTNERFEDENFLRLLFEVPGKYDTFGSDSYDFAYVYPMGTMLSRDGYWESSELYTAMGEPIEQKTTFDETLNEKLCTITKGFITTNPKDIVNLCKNKPKDYRILYDKNIDMYMIGDGNDVIHYDLLLSAYRDAYYYNMEAFIDSLGGFDNYIEIGQDGGWNAEDEEIEPYLYYIVFTQDDEWTLGTDGYDKKYDYDFGHILTRGCDLSEITLWDALGVPLNSEKLNETNEYIQLNKILEEYL